jgi:hypothetical protein
MPTVIGYLGPHFRGPARMSPSHQIVIGFHASGPFSLEDLMGVHRFGPQSSKALWSVVMRTGWKPITPAHFRSDATMAYVSFSRGV